MDIFSLIAQVNFSLVGLFGIVISLDKETRKYWMLDFTRRNYISITLLFLILPGIFAITTVFAKNYNQDLLTTINIVGLCFWATIILFILDELRKRNKDIKRAIYYQNIGILNPINIMGLYTGIHILFLILNKGKYYEDNYALTLIILLITTLLVIINILKITSQEMELYEKQKEIDGITERKNKIKEKVSNKKIRPIK